MRRLLFLPVAAVALAVLGPARAQEKDPTLEDELKLRSAFQKTDGASLAAFLRARARGDEAGHQKLQELVEALAAKSAADRQKACADLVAIGAPAVPVLRRAARDEDAPEAAALARSCLK